MIKNKPLTKNDLLDILAEFFHDRLRPEFEKVNKSLGKVEGRSEKVENRLKTVEVELGGVKNEIKGLKEEFSNTPSRREFNTLKQKVDRFHPNS